MAFTRLKAAIVLFVCLCLSPLQAQDRLCQEIVESALESVPRNCAGLERDQLCVSHPLVAASFVDAAQNADFEPPGERASAADLGRVRSSGLEMEAAHWGVALLYLGANLPQTYAGPGVIVLLAGAAEVVNEIDRGATVDIGEPLSTAALVETTLFSTPASFPKRLRRSPPTTFCSSTPSTPPATGCASSMPARLPGSWAKTSRA